MNILYRYCSSIDTIASLEFRRHVNLQLLDLYGALAIRPCPSSSYSKYFSIRIIRRNGSNQLIVKVQSKYWRCKMYVIGEASSQDRSQREKIIHKEKTNFDKIQP